MSDSDHRNSTLVDKVAKVERGVEEEKRERVENEENVENEANVENEDVALAKILQQQERAFQGYGLKEDDGPSAPPPGLNEDEKLAWELMREEEALFQRRMMAMAGIEVGRGASGGGDIFDDEENGDDDGNSLTYERLTTLGDLAGTVPCGLTEEQMAHLAHAKYEEVKQNDDPCIVCQMEFEAGDSVTKLPCSHVFHDECLRPWLSRTRKCPYCSDEVTIG